MDPALAVADSDELIGLGSGLLQSPGWPRRPRRVVAHGLGDAGGVKGLVLGQAALLGSGDDHHPRGPAPAVDLDDLDPATLLRPTAPARRSSPAGERSTFGRNVSRPTMLTGRGLRPRICRQRCASQSRDSKSTPPTNQRKASSLWLPY